MGDTKDKILEVAERLLILQGADRVTLRRITAEAGVNLAAINYHFGSKAELENALLARVMGPLEDRRLQLIDEAERAAGKTGPTLETIIRCYLLPVAEFADRHPNQHNIFIGLNRLFNDETRFREQVRKSFELTLHRFGEALLRALPNAPREAVLVRIPFMQCTATALLYRWLVAHTNETFGLDAAGTDILQEMVSFLAAGFRALLKGPPDG